jgi:starch synthase
MEILHVSAECWPVAKAGGLGDVAGALPRYQTESGHIAKLVMPMYRTPFLNNNSFEVVHESDIGMGSYRFHYTVIREAANKLGFDLYLIDINALLDRERIYGYEDDAERFTAFQIAVVDWMSCWNHRPDVVHVHDYHAGLVPFMMQHCLAYRHLAGIPTVLTVHNAQYQGWMDWSKSVYLPEWDTWQWGKLDWNNSINPLASAVKTTRAVTTVSGSYMEELRYSANGLEKLFEYERGKCHGILNGIDTVTWNPATDPFIPEHYDRQTVYTGKLANKKALAGQFQIDIEKPLFIFIGRLVHEKGADLLPQAIYDAVYHLQGAMNFLVLGTGEHRIERELENMRTPLTGFYNARIGYNEGLSHQLYAAADFLIMPSRVEPCGLNQLYALRYGTIPIVRNTGGLRDTVRDVGDEGGFGILFNEARVWDITYSIHRALELYREPGRLQKLREQIMQIDHSWTNRAGQYLSLYRQIGA